MELELENIINEKKKKLNKFYNLYGKKELHTLGEKYHQILKEHIPNYDKVKDRMKKELKSKGISEKKFYEFLKLWDYLTEYQALKKKHNFTDEEVKKLLNSNKISIFLDYDDIMVDLLAEWLKEYNLLINKWIKTVKKEYDNSLFETKITNKKELIKYFYKYFSNEKREIWQKNGFNIYGDPKKPLYEIKNEKDIENLIKNTEQFFIEKLWYAYKENVPFEIKRKDIKDFYIFNRIPLGINYLEKGNLYMDKNFQKNIVKPKKDALMLYNFLVKSKLINKTYILTSSFPGTEYSKRKHVEKNFPKLADHIITTHNKSVVVGNNGILVDDAIHNVLNTVINNEFAVAAIRSLTHNKELMTGKRIVRIDNLKEFIEYLPLLHLKVYDRMTNPELIRKQILGMEKEIFENKENNNFLLN